MSKRCSYRVSPDWMTPGPTRYRVPLNQSGTSPAKIKDIYVAGMSLCQFFEFSKYYVIYFFGSTKLKQPMGQRHLLENE
jgi:hypothetical protein